MEFKKLSEFKGDKAFEVIDQLLDPIAQIAQDEEFKKARKNKGASIKTLAHKLIKDHKDEIVTILAVISEQEFDDLRKSISPVDILNGTIAIFSDEDMLNLFR